MELGRRPPYEATEKMHVLNDGELMPKALYQAIHGVVVILNDGESLNSVMLALCFIPK